MKEQKGKKEGRMERRQATLSFKRDLKEKRKFIKPQRHFSILKIILHFEVICLHLMKHTHIQISGLAQLLSLTSSP